jgi:hypothetical protein
LVFFDQFFVFLPETPLLFIHDTAFIIPSRKLTLQLPFEIIFEMLWNFDDTETFPRQLHAGDARVGNMICINVITVTVDRVQLGEVLKWMCLHHITD